MDVLIFQRLIRSEQENNLDIVATRKLTGFGLKSGRDHSITCRGRDAPVLSIQHNRLGRFSLLLKLDSL